MILKWLPSVPVYHPGPVLQAPVSSWEAGCSAERPWEAAEGEAAQGAGRSKKQGKGRGCARLWWRGPWGAHACCSLQEQAPSSHSPFMLFLWGIHTELVKTASGKRKLLLWLREAHVLALTAVISPMQPMGSLPSSSQQCGDLEFTNQFPTGPSRSPFDLRKDPLTN